VAKLNLPAVGEQDGPARTLISYRNPDVGGDSTILIVDAVVGLSSEYGTEYTQFAVESGARFSDHAINSPEKLSVSLVQTQTPVVIGTEGYDWRDVTVEVPESRWRPQGFLLLSTAAEGAIRSAVGALFGGGPAVATNTMTLELLTGPENDRIAQLYEMLYDGWRANFLFTVTTSHRSYVDYMLTRLNFAQSGAAMKADIQLELQKVNTVTLGTAELPDPASFRNKASHPGGNKPPTPPKKEPGLRSNLRRGTDGLGLTDP
jgi:hypothetical protein